MKFVWQEDDIIAGKKFVSGGGVFQIGYVPWVDVQGKKPETVIIDLRDGLVLHPKTKEATADELNKMRAVPIEMSKEVV